MLKYFSFNLSIDNWIGVKGFFISCANFLATFSHASCLSDNNNLSCCPFNLSIIKLKFLFNLSISSSASIIGTFAFKFPALMLSDALIKLTMGLKNLEANFILIVIDKNNSSVTTII